MSCAIGVVRLRFLKGPAVGDAVELQSGTFVADAGAQLGRIQLEPAADAGPGRGQAALLQALARLAKQNGLRAAGSIVSADLDGCVAEITASIPERFCASPEAWKKGPAAATLFLHLQPPGSPGAAPAWEEDPADGCAATPAAESESEPYTLASCFAQLPQHAADLELPELLVSAGPSRPTLADVSVPLLRAIAGRLSLRDLASLAMSCRFFRCLASNAVPGLLLSLYPHQRAAVRWMLAREEAAGRIPDPTWRELPTGRGGPALWGCAASGGLRAAPPRECRDTRGGFFCDEPGLGKTITVLALVLKSRGTVPAPPEGCAACSLATAAGQRVGWYLLPPPDARQAATGPGRRSRQSGSSGAPGAAAGPQPDAGSPPSAQQRRELQALAPSPGFKSDALPRTPQSGRLPGAKLRVSASPASAPAEPHPPAAARPGAAAAAPAPAAAATAAAAAAAQPEAAAAVGRSQAAAQQQPRAVRFAEPGQPPAPAQPVRRAVSFAEQGSTAERAGQQGAAPSGGACLLGGGQQQAPPKPGRKGVRFADEPPAPEGNGSEAVERGPPAKRAKASGSGALAPAQGEGQATVAQQPAAAAAGEAGPEESQLLVQCELCSKWRSLPPGAQVDAATAWICRMHPTPSLADCAAKPEAGGDWQFDAAAGFAAEGAALGDPDAVRHFRELLAGFPELVSERHSAPWWLARQAPAAVAAGVQVPRAHLEESPPSFAALFKQLGLLPQKAAPRSSGSGGKPLAGGKGAGSRQAWWRQDPGLQRLRLDTPALLAALLEGPLKQPRRVFLSPATLLVVPAPLVPHWLHQAQQHTRFGSLRLLVLSSDRARSGRMPPPHALAWDYDLVITTLPILSATWANRGRRQASPFMQVHWLRLVVDEGHLLGTSLQATSRLQMGCALAAERRWLMTGTPTPGGGGPDTAHLQPLLAFLRSEPFGTEPSTWQEGVQRPFEAKRPEGHARLLQLLRRLMIRAAKSDLHTIPPLLTKVTVLDFAPEHAVSYNMLVDVVHRNLLTSDWYDEEHTESLLNHARNGRWAKEMLANVKKGCCVAGHCNLQAKESDIQEALELLTERHGLAPASDIGPPWLDAEHPFAHLEDAMRASLARHIRCLCAKCGSQTRMPLITPCAHLLCATCASEDRTACALPTCRRPYLMQSVADPARRETNPNPKWDVPSELIEWQPSYTQRGATGVGGGGWAEDWQFTASTKCTHLLRRLAAIGAAESPEHAQVLRDAGGGRLGGAAAKAIVFSQFWMHINLVKHHLSHAGVPFALLRGGLQPAEKAAALDTFQNDDECGVLLMDGTGAVGLDLSFAPWVFLLEPIEDSSLQQQVVSRAHRMGARQPVHLETLVMKGTAEEELVRLAAAERAGGGYSGAPDVTAATAPERDQQAARERARRNTILKALRRVPEAGLPDFQELPFARPEEGD